MRKHISHSIDIGKGDILEKHSYYFCGWDGSKNEFPNEAEAVSGIAWETHFSLYTRSFSKM